MENCTNQLCQIRTEWTHLWISTSLLPNSGTTVLHSIYYCVFSEECIDDDDDDVRYLRSQSLIG